MRGFRGPPQTAHNMRKVPVVPPQVHHFPVPLEPDAKILDRTARSRAQDVKHIRRIEVDLAQLLGDVGQAGEHGRLGVGQARVALELRVSEGEQAEGRARIVQRERRVIGLGERAAVEQRVQVQPCCAEEGYGEQERAEGEQEARELH
jgi:hypothetical protein